MWDDPSKYPLFAGAACRELDSLYTWNLYREGASLQHVRACRNREVHNVWGSYTLNLEIEGG